MGPLLVVTCIKFPFNGSRLLSIVMHHECADGKGPFPAPRYPTHKLYPSPRVHQARYGVFLTFGYSACSFRRSYESGWVYLAAGHDASGRFCEVAHNTFWSFIRASKCVMKMYSCTCSACPIPLYVLFSPCWPVPPEATRLVGILRLVRPNMGSCSLLWLSSLDWSLAISFSLVLLWRSVSGCMGLDDFFVWGRVGVLQQGIITTWM